MPTMSTNKRVKVLVIYTGGSVRMILNNMGYFVPTKNTFIQHIRQRPNTHDEEGFEKLPSELKSPATCLLPSVLGITRQIVYVIKEYDPLMDSCNMGSNDWKKIASDIEAHYDAYDGFVVIHGVDTLAYTASALSFCLENITKSVVITGSLLSVFESRTDGILNFINALAVAGMGYVPEVCVVFGGNIMRGCRTARYSSLDFHAIKTNNAPLLGTIQVNIEINKQYLMPSPKNATLKVHKEFNTNIVVLHFTPDMPIQMFKTPLDSPTEGAIILTFGLGNANGNRKDILEQLKAATKRGVIIVNITQCRHGTVENTFDAGEILGQCGVISGCDMTLEAAFTKLSYVLAQAISLDMKRKKMQENLRGELTLPPKKMTITFQE